MFWLRFYFFIINPNPEKTSAAQVANTTSSKPDLK